MPHEWKVRSMDETVSRAAVAAAERAHMTTAVWLGQAIQEKVAREREVIEGTVMPPEDANPAPPPGSDERPITPMDVLYAPRAPQWLVRGASRRVAAHLGIDPPVSRKPSTRRLAAPEPAAGAGTGVLEGGEQLPSS